MTAPVFGLQRRDQGSTGTQVCQEWNQNRLMEAAFQVYDITLYQEQESENEKAPQGEQEFDEWLQDYPHR